MSTLDNPPSNTSVGWKGESIEKNNLDFCRFWLSIMVIFSHSFAIATGSEVDEPLGILTRDQLNSGPFAVCCFFAISGFLITHSWLRSRTVLSFLQKRVLRIYPGYIIAVLFGIFVVAPFASEHFEFTSRNVLTLPLNLIALHRVDLPGVFPHNPYPGSLNGSLWSIPYEFKCYIGVIILGGLGLFSNRKWLIVWLLIGVVVAGVIYPFAPVPVFERGAFAAIVGGGSAWCRVLPYFVAGMAFYLFRNQISASPRFVMTAMIAIVLASMFPPAGRLVFPFAITYLLFWFAFHPSIKLHRWSRYGDFSYGIYLYAFPIQQLVTQRMPGISAITLFLVATPLAVIAGVISWYLVEMHFLKAKRHFSIQQTTNS